MSGYVARKRGSISFTSDDLEFMMDKKDLRKEKIFPSREECIKFFREEKHYSIDDLKYMFWFESGEDIRRNLWTNEIEKN